MIQWLEPLSSIKGFMVWFFFQFLFLFFSNKQNGWKNQLLDNFFKLDPPGTKS